MNENQKPKTTDLIEELLQREDPALVGVKKILRKRKGASSEESSFHSHTPEVFQAATPDKSEDNTSIFTDNEREIVGLEKEIIELRTQMEAKEQEKQVAIEEAYAAGIEEGRRVQEEVAREQFAIELQEINQHADSSFMELVQRDLLERENYYITLTDDLIGLVFAIAKKVIQTSVEANPEIVKGVVRRALFYIADKNGIEIRVNPDDNERVTELVDSFKSEGERFSSVSVSSDSSIDPGGCVIETAAGIVDAQIDRQIVEIEAEISRAWHEMTASQEGIHGAPQL